MKYRIGLPLIAGILVMIFFLLFSIVKVSDNTMYPTLEQGQYVFVKKLNPEKIEHYHLIACHSPETSDGDIRQKASFVSRVAALPGDTLLIQDKSVYINGKQKDSPASLYFKYRLSINDDFNISILENYPLYKPAEIIEGKAWEFHCSPEIASQLGRLKGVVNIRQLQNLPGKGGTDIFPHSQFISWNNDYYGPVVIPKAGQEIHLHYKNIQLYKRLISVYEGHQLYLKSRKIFIDGEEADSFVPSQNYYFVLDDLRDGGYDSRHIGFIPENHIIGIKPGSDGN